MLTASTIAWQRLANQQLTDPSLETPAEVVHWLGAVQAQDYAGAKWAVAQRAPGVTHADVEQALTDGAIVRTHVLRPTWHFVAAGDIRWMLMLSGPRVRAAMAGPCRMVGLDAATFRRSHAAMTRALRDGRQLTRIELAAVLARAGIATGGGNQRLTYLMMVAELEGLVCSGAKRDKQFTYALLDERVPPAESMRREEALCELTLRYFQGRGPATLQDFSWWSGLTLADAKLGVEMLGPALAHHSVEGRTYWFTDQARPPKKQRNAAHLLPNYDEYFIGFRDRSAILQIVRDMQVPAPTGAPYAHVISVNGQLVGGWKPLQADSGVAVEMSLVAPVTDAQRQAVRAAARRYAAFLELPLREHSP